MADHLKLSEMPLATTPGGKNFAFKALHPAAHEIKTARVPGGNAMSACLCSDQVTTVSVPDANSSIDIVVSPNIVAPASLTVKYPGADAMQQIDPYTFFNAAFGGSVVKSPTSNHYRDFLTRLTAIQTYRITSQSVTVELIAPSLSNQGTITAAQYHLPPRVTGFAERQLNADSYSDRYAQIYPKILLFEEPVNPSQLVLGTSAYTSKARDGCYMPLKLTNLDFQNMNDPAMMKTVPTELCRQGAIEFSAGGIDRFPYYINKTGDELANTPVFPPFCGYNFGFITIAGVAADVAVRVRVRQVVEITSYPSSTYSPIMEVALPPDDVSIRMYYEVSQRMQDAYPASYNDLGKLRGIINTIAKKVSPFVSPALDILSHLPGVAGAVGKIGKRLVPKAQNFLNAAEQANASAMAVYSKVVGGEKPAINRGANLVRAALKRGDEKFLAKRKRPRKLRIVRPQQGSQSQGPVNPQGQGSQPTSSKRSNRRSKSKARKQPRRRKNSSRKSESGK